MSKSSSKAPQYRALIVDPDENACGLFSKWLRREGFDADCCSSLATARAELADTTYQLALLEHRVEDGDGLDLIPTLDDAGIRSVFVLSSHSSVDGAVQALRAGVLDYLEKPISEETFRRAIARARDHAELHAEIAELRQGMVELGSFGSLVGGSDAMREVYHLIEQVAPTEASVMLVGETGTGKEVVAETIHQMSRRKHKRLLAINCGAVPQNLIESELFGHEKGAFTGADRGRRGVFERARGGTIFLDEITEMPLELQPTLLRVLESGQFTRVGGEKVMESDSRIISATNRDALEAVEEGVLREDLLYRLNVFPIQLPPLRDREGDVERLARHFLAGLNRRHGTQRRIADSALRDLERYDWPGNVRQLKNVVERSFILSGDTITEASLPDSIPRTSNNATGGIDGLVGRTIKDVERELILATMEECGGNKTRAAKVLGISLKTLYTRLNRYSEAS